MWQTVSSGKVWSGRVTRPNKDGGVFTENVTISPIRNEHGNIINYVAVKHNITRELELEAQYRQSQKMEAIGQLAGGIAHDFNNLLVPILGYADLGMRKLSPENALYTDLARIREAGKRAAALTRQILAFSRKQILQVQPLNLNTIVKEFSTMLRRLLRDNINLQLILPPEPGWIEADKTQIEQVLMNLVINAQQAMLNGGELIIETTNVVLDKQYAQKRIEIQPGNYVMMAVSDTGCGMDKETQQRIFEPFFTTKKKDKGTGLGLATVFGIVKQHGGSIWVYSEINQGTTFKIYFPRIKEGSYPSTTETAEITTVFGTETILVVEDEEAVRRLVCETLEAHGYTVIETKNPTHALKMAAAHKKPIHLLLTDVIMPEMNGVELYQTLKEIRPHIKVLYMSGYTDNAIVHHGILKASVHFLQKPFTIHSLTQKVREVFDILPPTQTSKK
jgi:signal transduction histidine kinase/ActR/RegA family two-component response regulator